MNKRSLWRLDASAVFAAVLLTTSAQAQLWRDDISYSMYADKRASRVGDIITIVVQENTTANKNNETKTERQSSLNAKIAAFVLSPSQASLIANQGKLPVFAFNSDQKHDGSGSINNSESIIGYVAVRVIDVLPNSNMVIEGKRETSFGGEHQTILLRGLVRLDDITSNNTVLSYNVADASIHIISSGTVTDSTRKGWFSRIWDKISPF